MKINADKQEVIFPIEDLAVVQKALVDIEKAVQGCLSEGLSGEDAMLQRTELIRRKLGLVGGFKKVSRK